MARRTRQISLKECYDILRLQKGATLQDVKTAYRRRAFELHPDLNPGDPEAGRQFQLLNEAYVALSAMLKDSEETRQHAEKKQEPKPDAGKSENDSGGTAHKSAEQPHAEHSERADAQKTRAGEAYAEQDVLRDLLNDPFARRVFEDIYSELNREKEAPKPEKQTTVNNSQQQRPSPPVREPEKAKTAPLWERGQEKGVKGMFKDLLRRQLDDEQSIVMPAHRLAPGSKIRLRIRKSMSDEPTAVDVRLPPDFVVGKPMRLKGLGRRVGPWQGDLYLTIYTK